MMVNIKRTWLLLFPLCAILLTGCPAVQTYELASHVDVAKYMGKWYEIAKFPQIFQQGLVGVTAEYTLQNDGTVKIKNQGYRNTLTGPVQSITGVATVADTATNAKLKIRFDPFPLNLFRADYWIVEIGDNYEYAVVSNPSQSALWILSRTPTLDENLYNSILERLKTKGFDIGRLEKTVQ